MSPDIILEFDFLVHSVLMGIWITFIYDLLRIFRRVAPHNSVAVSMEDLCYWISCAVIIFRMLYRENNGVLRWFAVAGAMTGMFFYKITLSFFLVKYISLLLNKVLYVVGKILLIILRPLALVMKGAKQGGRRSASTLKRTGKRLKKKLTAVKKMLKLILYKQ